MTVTRRIDKAAASYYDDGVRREAVLYSGGYMKGFHSYGQVIKVDMEAG
ncbi:MAG: hypothetical protein FWF83_06630 [Clostridiales bacterium]|nr:hypothetical protein [Clostridiales bacterium]